MNTPNEELKLAIAMLIAAMPQREHWSGPAAEICRTQIENLIHELRAVTY